MDLEVFDPARQGFEPIVAIYGLNPAAVAMGVMAQRADRHVPIVEYVDTLTASSDIVAQKK